MVYFFFLWSFLLVLFSFVSRLLLKRKGVAEVSDNAPQTIWYDAVDTQQEEKNDVFVSFRGEDIRDGFLSHLVAAFHRKKINAFVDDKLQKGEEIWSSIVGSIEESSVSVIIFSENYASSRWCLNELVKILECRDKYEQIVIPVFYRVDPTDVRHQTGSYETAFVEHGKKFDTTMLQLWSDALKKSADLSGIKSADSRNDAELLDNITNDVLHQLKRLSKHTLNSKGLVGIGKSIADIEALLHKNSKGVRIIGIWGMGGIGKTTIAEQVFNKICSEYEGTCFLSNVREESTRHGMICLKEKLFTTLLEEDVKMNSPNGLPDYIGRRISRMKVLIVLDDVNDSDQLELFGTVDEFGPGSRIIVTTRDKQLLIAKEVDDIHEVGVLSSGEALELFNLIALKQSRLEVEYYELAERAVKYANGIPLVLKVLGHLLCGKDLKAWESHLDKLMEMPSKEVYDVMILSYHDLDRKEQRIFLDLACFFKGLDFEVDLIKALVKDCESDNSVAHGLERLRDKALIVISEDGVVSMHDIIEEIAWEIVRQESREDIGSQIHLRGADDFNKLLENDKGNEVVRSIWLHSSMCTRKLKLSSQIFTKMSKLQFLDFCNGPDDSDNDVLDDGGHVLLPKGLQSLPTGLRYLRWWQYPLNYLPKKFCAEKLVILDLSHSRLKRLWHGVQNLVNLKQVELHNCIFLKELPDFSKATNLEELNASFCHKLTSVHSSIFTLDKLENLDLSYCWSLTSITSNAQSSCLSHVQCNSRSLEELPDFSTATNLKVLDASNCHRLTNVHPSIFTLDKFEKLDLSYCSSLTNLTSNAQSSCLSHVQCNSRSLEELPYFSKATNLKVLDASNCHRLTNVHPSIFTLDKLEKLDLSYCWSLTSLCAPSSCLSHLQCNSQSLEELPDFSKATNLKVLDASNCHQLTNVHPSIFTLDKLEKLDLSYCWSLTSLISNAQSSCLCHLQCNSRSLEELPDFSKATNLKVLDASNCHQLTNVHPSIFTLDKLEKLDLSRCSSLTSLTSNAQLSCLCYLNLKGCGALIEFSVTLENLVELNLGGTSIKTLLPSFGNHSKLEILHLESSEIENLPARMENLTRLRYLNLSQCLNLQELPELPPSLETLLVRDCISLKTVLFPSIRTQQFQENKKRVEFCHFSEWGTLDEFSFMAFGLNAQINVMKFAHQHLTAPNHENYDDYLHNYDSYQAVYIFPGSRVPKWLEYNTMGNSGIIDLSSPPPSPPFGFIFCFIIDQCLGLVNPLKIKVSIRDSAGEDNVGDDENTIEVYMSYNSTYIREDHVCVIYDQRCSHYLSRRSQNLSRFQIKVTTKYESSVRKKEFRYADFGERGIELKGFGLSLISTSKYDNFVRHIL